MTCGLDRLNNELDQVKYIACQMQSGAERTGEACVTANGMVWPEVKFCHDNRLGYDLQIAAENEQNRVLGYPSFVPTIVVNEQADSGLSNRLYTNFKVTFCELIGNNDPYCRT